MLKVLSRENSKLNLILDKVDGTFHKNFGMRTWRAALQVICASAQICSWSTWYPEIPSNC